MLVSDCIKSHYLAECRILASEMRKLVNMVRKGGGSRCLSFNDKLTHIVIGNPTE
ncbi:DNA topoisomerase 2-binding protein 1-like, partial [Trifolium medium]|nr:DNA topoisomerase 2-binding protein 1-like [Trifolium medium]